VFRTEIPASMTCSARQLIAMSTAILCGEWAQWHSSTSIPYFQCNNSVNRKYSKCLLRRHHCAAVSN
jgi:hypothetical protein